MTESMHLLFQNGAVFVGMALDEGVPLAMREPLQFQAVLQQGPGGATNVGHQCQPVCWLPSLKAMPIVSGSVLVPLTDLSKQDRQQIERAYEQGQRVASDLKLAQLRIAPAREMPKGNGAARIIP